MYAKLINGRLTYPRKVEQVDGFSVCNPTSEQLVKLGYLPVRETETPMPPDGKHYEISWKVVGNEIVQTWSLVDDTVYPEPDLTAEEALEIITGMVK